jgi:Zn-dependent protease
MFDLDPATLIARAVVLLIAFTIHELAHAVTADRLGDPTARQMGRITLNPLAHLDPFGTILLLLAGFGWAKPVPVNPYRLRGNPQTSFAIVAAAGPISNLIMAALAAIVIRTGLIELQFATSGNLPSLGYLLFEFVWINLILAFFNLIPVPPLDGYRILSGLLPPDLAFRIRPLERYGFMLLMVVVFLAPAVLQVIVVAPSQATLRLLLGL